MFFLDEIDASIPEVLVILNAAIANGYFDFPCGRKDAHKDFRVIAAGNTKGTGADNNYTGRYSLDRASLDRFALVEINYSPTIESSVCNNNTELLAFTHSFRKATEKANIECLFSYRTISRISSLEDSDIPLKDIIEYSLIKGLDKDDVNIIAENIKKDGLPTNNKYYDALISIY